MQNESHPGRGLSHQPVYDLVGGEGTLLVQGWQVNRWCAAWQGQHPTQKGRGMENSLPPRKRADCPPTPAG